MKLAVIAITNNGTNCAEKISKAIDADLYIKENFKTQLKNEKCFLIDDFKKTIESMFNSYEGIIFVMAAGIVVRSIAPHIRDKQSDPAVVVVDEMGQFSISLLSGHIGGANSLALRVGEVLNATPVITTATDINGVTAFDELAARNGCIIENIKELKFISSELVNGGKVSFYTDLKTIGTLRGNIEYGSSDNKCAVVISNKEKPEIQAERFLLIRPKNLVIGIGCKKGKAFNEISDAVRSFLSENNKSILSVRSIASISLKSEEQGIIEFSNKTGIPFVTFLSEELQTIEHNFEGSEFVKKVTGTGSVCEASAIMESKNGRLIQKKTIYNGITLALAEDEKIIELN